MFVERVFDMNFPSIAAAYLSESWGIHLHIELGTESWVSLVWRSVGMMVLKAELKSTNRILTQVPDLFRCFRM